MITRHLRLILLGACILVTHSYVSVAADCENVQAQPDLNECASLEFEQADAELNATWKRVKKVILSDSSDDAAKERFGALISSQKAWIAFRDAQCEWEGFGVRDGQMWPMVVSSCKAQMTQSRIEFLSKIDE